MGAIKEMRHIKVLYADKTHLTRVNCDEIQIARMHFMKEALALSISLLSKASLLWLSEMSGPN